MIHLGEYDPRLEGIWWVEEAGMSCNVYVLNEGRTLIDAGNYYGMLHELSQEFDISLLEQLFITHCHFDHVGGMGELFDWSKPKVYAHIDTLPYINFRNVPFMKIMEKSGRIDQVVMLRGGERIPVGPYLLEVIPTPGHTKGDICLYEHHNRILFSGDTVFPSSPTENILSDADKQLGNMDQQIASLARLVPYPVDFLLPGTRHAGLLGRQRPRAQRLYRNPERRGGRPPPALPGRGPDAELRPAARKRPWNATT